MDNGSEHHALLGAFKKIVNIDLKTAEKNVIVKKIHEAKKIFYQQKKHYAYQDRCSILSKIINDRIDGINKTFKTDFSKNVYVDQIDVESYEAFIDNYDDIFCGNGKTIYESLQKLDNKIKSFRGWVKNNKSFSTLESEESLEKIITMFKVNHNTTK